MQVTGGNNGTQGDCSGLFSAFEQVNTGPTGTTWYAVQQQLGKANKITSSGSSNLFLYERPGCRAEVYLVDGRAVRKSFVIIPPAGTTTNTQAAAPQVPFWAILAICVPLVIIGLVLMWRLTRPRDLIPYGVWPSENVRPGDHNSDSFPPQTSPPGTSSIDSKKPKRVQDDAPDFNQRWGTK